MQNGSCLGLGARGGIQLQRGTWECFKEMEMFYMLIAVMVT